MKKTLIFALAMFTVFAANAALKMPWLFDDHMVVQQKVEIPVWGEADPGSAVTVSFSGQSQQARAGKDGKWIVKFNPLPASAVPKKMVITSSFGSGKDVVEINDILVGEVWLSAGQSNMWYPLKSCIGGKESAAAAGNINIRLLNRRPNAHPSGRVWNEKTLALCTLEKFYGGSWTVDSPESAAAFSAVAYWFGQKLHKELKVPIGLINVAVGGTTTEAYTSREGLLSHPLLKPIVESDLPWFDNEHVAEWPRGRAKQNLSGWLKNPTEPMPRHPFEPIFLFESAIQPLVPMAFAGVIWYQGESNATDAGNKVPVPKVKVRAGIETMIRDWRKQWKREFPFYYVQLPGMGRPWELFREVQLECLNIPNTGMAVTIDVGNNRNVHPRNKQPVGDRLALWALAKTYGHKIVYSSPLYKGQSKYVGSKFIIEFEHIGKGLGTSDKKSPRGFEIAAVDCIYHPADASVKGNVVTLSSSAVKVPVMARYAWAPFPDCNMVNSAGLPMSPFRTNNEDSNRKQPEL